MSIENIAICFEQKNLFMTKIINITKQLEVKSKQDEVDFENLLAERQECMNRIDKCNQAINSYTDALENEIDKKVIKDFLSNSHVDFELYPQLQFLKEHSIRYKELVQHALSIDNIATSILNDRYVNLRDKVNDLRKQGSTQNMYNNIK